MEKVPELLGTSGAARLLQLHELTVRKLADQGKLPVTRDSAGRRVFRREDIERLARERKGWTR